jgi:GNAT superfamily N-acetyltransferase
MLKPHLQATIREATPNDSAGILECLHTAFEVYRTSYTPDAFLDTILTPAALRYRLATMCLFVAVNDSGEIVGTIGCHAVNTVEGRHEAHIHESHIHDGHIRGMAVLPAWQGSGVAAQLLKAAESELRNRGCSRITLDTTEPLLEAMRFYEKNGFVRSGKVTDFFGMNLIEYVRKLDGSS